MKTITYILLFFSILFKSNLVFGVEYSSINEQFGYWQNGSTWTEGNTPPTSLNNDNVTIRGTVFTVGSLNLDITGGNNMFLTIDPEDTLVVNGSLNLKNNITLIVNGVIVVLGDFTSQNKLTISSSGAFLVTGNFTEGNKATITLNDTTSLYLFKTNNIDPTDFQPVNTTNNQVGTYTDFYIEQRPLYDWLNANFNNILPVTLSKFEATRNSKANLITWETESETNNDFFAIERSIDGQLWEAIARVDGSGSTTVEHTYSYTDEFAPDGIVYYMLKQSDYDGTSVNSKMISVNKITKRSIAKVIVYPNITSSDISLQSYDKVVITGIFSSNASKILVDIDSNSQTVSVESLPDGMYYIMYKTIDGLEHTQSFVKE